MRLGTLGPQHGQEPTREAIRNGSSRRHNLNDRDEVVFLEEPRAGPKTLDELQQHQAERERRRAQKAVPSWRR